jgi:hypothetical protein
VNSTDKAKLFLKISVPKKAALFQRTKTPPEAPREGMKQKLSKEGGQRSLMKGMSKFSFLVSYRHTISHWLSDTLFLRDSHLLSALTPLIFQHKTFQDLLLFLAAMANTSRIIKGKYQYA